MLVLQPRSRAPPRKDIPAIAKAANGAIVSIVMSTRMATLLPKARLSRKHGRRDR